MASETSQDTDGTTPVPTDEALRQLQSDEFVTLVTDLWEERGWTVVEDRPPETQRVTVRLRQRWPHQRTGLLQIRPGGLDSPDDQPNRLNRTDVQQFVQTVQREDVDTAYIVSATTVSPSIRETAGEFGIVVIGPDDLAHLIDRSGAHSLVAQRVPQPVVPMTEPFEIPWLLGRLNRTLDRLPYEKKLKAWVDRRLPTNPTTQDITRATFTGFRVAYLLVLLTFGLLFIVNQGSLAVLVVMLLIMVVTYGGLLPMMAADIYFTRRAETTRWTPTWWSLASFVLYPLPLFVGGFYWYRRRERTSQGVATQS